MKGKPAFSTMKGGEDTQHIGRMKGSPDASSFMTNKQNKNQSHAKFPTGGLAIISVASASKRKEMRHG